MGKIQRTGLHRLPAISADIQTLLLQRGMPGEALHISECRKTTHCNQAHCIRCMSRRVRRERNHLTKALPELLAGHPSYQVWLLTGAAEDSDEIHNHGLAAVRGTRRLLKHPRLKGRIIAHFSVLEVAHKFGRDLPCAHVHTLVVTRPMDKGKYRLSRKDWIAIWEECCDLHRPAKPVPQKRKRKRGHGKYTNISMHAKMVRNTVVDRKMAMDYCTKWATPKRIATDYNRMLAPDPDVFLHRIKALKGVTRFFGELHKA